MRITTAAGWTVTRETRASVEGLSFQGIHSYSSTSQAPPNAGRLGWNDVTRVDVPVNHGLRAGLITGLVLTGVAAYGLKSAADSGNDVGGGGMALIGIPILAGVAYWIAAAHPGWHRVYP